MAPKNLSLGSVCLPIIVIFVICFLYYVRYREYCHSANMEQEVRSAIAVGDDIELAREVLKEKGLKVATIERLDGFGSKSFYVSLSSKNSRLDSFRHATGINPLPYSYEPKHWLVVEADTNSGVITSLTTR